MLSCSINVVLNKCTHLRVASEHARQRCQERWPKQHASVSLLIAGAPDAEVLAGCAVHVLTQACRNVHAPASSRRRLLVSRVSDQQLTAVGAVARQVGSHE